MTDKIYSRKRFILCKIKVEPSKRQCKRPKRVIVIGLIAFISAFTIISRINPMFNLICTEKAKAMATEIINMEANTLFKDINYEDLVNTQKDEKRRNKNVKG